MTPETLATLPAMPKDTTYNGWKNRQTWNVALWIGNDEGLYRGAVEYAKRRQAAGRRPTYRGYLAYMGLDGRTPDNIAWNGSRLDLVALNRMLFEFAND